jgi:predicted dehydrogenase
MLTLAARKYKVATQMGNQGHSGEGNRQLCEMIWAGAIGPVREVHCWTDRPIWPQGIERPTEKPPVPAQVDWDLFLGPAPWRPYHSAYHPFKWRGWWDFGCGALGDMGCHIMDGAVWALKLGHPTSVETVESSPVNSETAPKWSIICYQFPARGDMASVTLTWYDGGKKPERPSELGEGKQLESNGSLFIGDKGKILTGTYGENPRLLPESKFKDYVAPPKTIPRVPGPYKDWIQACKGGTPACSNFDVAGPFTEIVLLGNLALRAGQKIEWDGPGMKAKNAPETAQYVRREYRKGWTL